MKVLLENVSKHKQVWLDRRKGKVTSSMIPTICGLNRWKSPLELWAQLTGKEPQDEENDDMWLGTQMQPVIGKLAERKAGVKLIDADCLVQHDSIDWALASPDFWEGNQLYPTGITECKCTGMDWSDGAPLDATLQLQWQLGVCGLERGHVAGLIRGSARKFQYLEVEFSAEVFDMALQQADEFRALVQKDIPPTAGKGDLELLARMQGLRVDSVVNFNETDVVGLFNKWDMFQHKREALREHLSEVEQEMDAIKSKFVQLMGNATMGKYFDRTVTAKTVRVAEHMRKASEYLKVVVN